MIMLKPFNSDLVGIWSLWQISATLPILSQNSKQKCEISRSFKQTLQMIWRKYTHTHLINIFYCAGRFLMFWVFYVFKFFYNLISLKLFPSTTSYPPSNLTNEDLILNLHSTYLRESLTQLNNFDCAHFYYFISNFDLQGCLRPPVCMHDFKAREKVFEASTKNINQRGVKWL